MPGCRSSRLSRYPDFPEQKKNLGSLTVLSDCMIVQSLRGDTDKIDLMENEDVGVRVLQICADMLREKGYTVNNTIFSSIGLLMKQNQLYKVIRTADERRLDDGKLPLASAPFYVNKAIIRDSTFLVRLAYVYNALLNARQEEQGSKTIVREAISIGKTIGNGALAVVLTGGYNVPVSKKLGEPARNTSLTQNVVTMQSISHLSMVFFIIDTKTGEVIWDDRQFKNEGVVMPEKYFSMIKDMLQDLP